MIARPTMKMATAQMRRPAGRIHGSQSGIKLGIGPWVLPMRSAVATTLRRAVSYHANGASGISGVVSGGPRHAATRDDARMRRDGHTSSIVDHKRASAG